MKLFLFLFLVLSIQAEPILVGAGNEAVTIESTKISKITYRSKTTVYDSTKMKWWNTPIDAQNFYDSGKQKKYHDKIYDGTLKFGPGVEIEIVKDGHLDCVRIFAPINLLKHQLSNLRGAEFATRVMHYELN